MNHPESDQLTRHPYEMAPGVEDIPSTWIAPRDRLRAELAPQSLTDRIVADGIERIACRVYCATYGEGYSVGVGSGYNDALMWLRAIRAREEVRGSALAFGILWDLEERIRQSMDG